MPPTQVLLSYVLPDGKTDAIFIDATVNEQHTAQAQITEHPVETGANVTDYIRPMPRRLSLSGVITNTPIAPPLDHAGEASGKLTHYKVRSILPVLASANDDTFDVLAFSSDFDRVRAVYGSLVDAALGGALFTITTRLHTYAKPDGTGGNMAITNFAVPRDVSMGNAIQFSIDFQEVRIVATEEVAIPARGPSKSQHRGHKAPAEVPAGDQRKSTLRALVKKLSG